VSVNLDPEKGIRRKVARLPAVRAAVKEAATEIGERASANAAAHRQEGNLRVRVSRDPGRTTDWLVWLEDNDPTGAAVLAIEFGSDRPNGTHVPGLYVLYSAAGLI
jgi:Family of unknown function (DUF5403)